MEKGWSDRWPLRHRLSVVRQHLKLSKSDNRNMYQHDINCAIAALDEMIEHETRRRAIRAVRVTTGKKLDGMPDFSIHDLGIFQVSWMLQAIENEIEFEKHNEDAHSYPTNIEKNMKIEFLKNLYKALELDMTTHGWVNGAKPS